MPLGVQIDANQARLAPFKLHSDLYNKLNFEGFTDVLEHTFAIKVNKMTPNISGPNLTLLKTTKNRLKN
jgi:hypothetical protein